MNESTRKKKGLLALTLLAVVCLSLLAGGTYAYFTAEETAHNVITMGTLNMELVEETTGGVPWPDTGMTGLMPGMTVDKVAYVRNSGSVPFYARMKVEKTVTLEDGTAVDADLAQIVLDINTEAWTEQDGWYYLNTALAAGQDSTPLFTTVSLAPEMGNEYQKSNIIINVVAQAVQSGNNGASALAAQGWPVETVIVTE